MTGEGDAYTTIIIFRNETQHKRGKHKERFDL
jgi:hypothetical protein